MAMSFSTTLRNTLIDAMTSALNAGTGTTGATLAIRSGTRPANVGTAATGTLLGTLTCSATCAPAAANGTTTFNAITQDSSADATGTATWGRAFDKAGTAIFDFNISTTGAELNLSNTAITAGGPISVSSMVLTDGNP